MQSLQRLRHNQLHLTCSIHLAVGQHPPPSFSSVRSGTPTSLAFHKTVPQKVVNQCHLQKQQGNRKLCRPLAASASSAAMSPTQFLEPGRYQPKTLDPITITLGTPVNAEEPVRGQLEFTVPKGQQKCPLVLLSAGFLLDAALYRSYAEFLASHGYAVALYDFSELVDDISSVTYLWSILNTATSNPRVSNFVDPARIVLAGHSRGGKLSVLAAAADPRVKGLLLLDPVDNTSMTPGGPGYPSCLTGLSTVSALPRRLPVLVVGAALNQDVIPAEGNYRRFSSAVRGPFWEVDLTGAGHLQFLDRQIGLLSLFSAGGPTPDSAVRQVSQAVMLAWLEAVIQPTLTNGSVPDPAATQKLLEATASACNRIAPLTSTIRNLSAATSSTSSTGYNAASRAGNAASGSPSGGRTAAGTGSNSAGSSSSSAGAGTRSSGGFAGGAAAGSTSTGQKDFASVFGTNGKNSSSSSPPPPPPRSSAGTAAGFTSSASARGSGGPASSTGPLGLTYEQLMQMRAKEIKAMLVERGIECGDCFEKQDLARRLVERSRA